MPPAGQNDPRQSTLLDVAALTNLIDIHFPQVHEGSGPLIIEQVMARAARVRMTHDIRMVRPGGTISGPTMFKLADFTIYVAILGQLGEGALQAVTTNLNINFLTRPTPGDMLAEARLIKLGRRLVVAEVELYAAAHDEMVAHATGTYALPMDRVAVK